MTVKIITWIKTFSFALHWFFFGRQTKIRKLEKQTQYCFNIEIVKTEIVPNCYLTYTDIPAESTHLKWFGIKYMLLHNTDNTNISKTINVFLRLHQNMTWSNPTLTDFSWVVRQGSTFRLVRLVPTSSNWICTRAACPKNK